MIFCAWYDRTLRGAAYVSQFYRESGWRSSPFSGSDLKCDFEKSDVLKSANYTHVEMCSIYLVPPVILVASCTRFDRGSQLYL